MNNVIPFPTKNSSWKVLFNLPKGKVLKINKGPHDDFDLEIQGDTGTALIDAKGRSGAAGRIKCVFPKCEIINVTRL